MIIYKFRQEDRVYDCEVEVPDGTTAIPAYHTFQAPPVLENHYAVMRNGWMLLPGEKPNPPTPPLSPSKYVPEKVTRFQAKAVLHNIGLLTAAQSLVDNSEDPLVKLVWQEALHFERNSQVLNSLAQALGLSEEETDDLFIAAEQISV